MATAPAEAWAPQPWEDCEGGGRDHEAGPDDYRAVAAALEASVVWPTFPLADRDYDRRPREGPTSAPTPARATQVRAARTWDP